MIFTDSNILVRSVQTRGPQLLLTEAALAKLRNQQAALCIAPQAVVDFSLVATRPVVNVNSGLLAYTEEVLKISRQILLAHNGSGKQVHEAYVVAIMMAYSITSILTFNDADFKRYPGITVLDPAQI